MLQLEYNNLRYFNLTDFKCMNYYNNLQNKTYTQNYVNEMQCPSAMTFMYNNMHFYILLQN